LLHADDERPFAARDIEGAGTAADIHRHLESGLSPPSPPIGSGLSGWIVETACL
jgi:hypothetical protein